VRERRPFRSRGSDGYSQFGRGSGANTWYAGDAVFNTGNEGEGFIDLYSDSGVFPGSTYGPTIVGNVRFVSGAEKLTDTSFEGAGSEELSNTGFETAGGGGADVFANWTESASDGAIASEGTLVNAGSAACKLTAGASVDTNVSQTITVSEAESFHISFYTRGDGTYDGRYRIYDVTNASDIVSLTSTGVTGTTYTLVEVFFSIPDQCTSMRIDLYCPSTNTGIAYFDDTGKLIGAASTEAGISTSNYVLTTNASGIPVWTTTIDGGAF